jgi:hypothetical protein
LKPERWDSPFVQEKKYRGETACDNIIIIIIIIIIQHTTVHEDPEGE